MNEFRIKFRVQRILYPRTGLPEIGGNCILGCEIVEDKEKKIILNNYNNFVVKCWNSIAFNTYDIYEADVKQKIDNRGVSYEVCKLYTNFEVETEGDKRAFLEAILTPSQVYNLYQAFPDPYKLLEEENIDELKKCKGISDNTVKFLIAKYKKNCEYKEILIKLKQYDLSMKMIEKLLNHYKSPEVVIEKIKENVYILADEVNGIGFIKCDNIALKGGMPIDSPLRLDAYINYFLEGEANNNGNCWVTPPYFFNQVMGFFGNCFTSQDIGNALNRLKENNQIWWDENQTKIALLKYRNLEENICEELCRLNYTTIDPYAENTEEEKKILEEIQEANGFNYNEEQLNATKHILRSKVSTLVGYSGSGKTTVTKLFATMFARQGLNIGLCSFSGKSASRIYEATGFEGSTIHRLLKYNPDTNSFLYCKSKPLPYNVVIVDECSFLDAQLFYSLLQAMSTGSKLILIGDNQQLPCIGVGNIFQDILDSNFVDNNILTQIHRQAQESGIISTGYLIRNQQPIFKLGFNGVETRGVNGDLTIDIYDDRSLGIPKLLDYYYTFCPTLADTKETQILLCKKQKGECCSAEINNLIQQKLNPPNANKKELTVMRNGASLTFRVGDRVINRKNNYNAKAYCSSNSVQEDYDFFDPIKTSYKQSGENYEIFNGFSGTVLDITSTKHIIIKFDLVDEPIEFTEDEYKNLELSYAITVHLSQGSEFKNIIFLMDYSSYIMNNKEMLYTAITRAKQNCVLLGEGNAIKSAIKTSQTNTKQTFLKELLMAIKVQKNNKQD